MGEVIVLRPQPKIEESCMNCASAYIGKRGIYCAAYDEFIDDDGVAKDCDLYEMD